VQVGKREWVRPRPYEVSSSIHPSVNRPGDSGSHPSGHSANVFAEATVLSALDPTHADDYVNTAFEMTQARVVGGAHFPSDVVAGTYIGTRAGLREVHGAADLVARIAGRAS
jgi:acid phosphatase (class A)